MTTDFPTPTERAHARELIQKHPGHGSQRVHGGGSGSIESTIKDLKNGETAKFGSGRVSVKRRDPQRMGAETEQAFAQRGNVKLDKYHLSIDSVRVAGAKTSSRAAELVGTALKRVGEL